MERQIDELLEHGLIEPSTSEWRSPVVMIHKRDRSYHFAVDYCKFNATAWKMENEFSSAKVGRYLGCYWGG